jgi:hypothetical protein
LESRIQAIVERISYDGTARQISIRFHHQIFDLLQQRPAVSGYRDVTGLHSTDLPERRLSLQNGLFGETATTWPRGSRVSL